MYPRRLFKTLHSNGLDGNRNFFNIVKYIIRLDLLETMFQK